MVVLNFTSWNVHGWKRISKIACEFLKTYDIICLQETWLHEHEENYFGDLMNNYNCVCKTSMQADVFHRGRPFGGLAFLYKKALAVHITHIGSEYKNLDVICLKFGDRKVFVVNVNVPCCNNDNEDEINELVANIFCTWELGECDDIIVCGDFNMHVTSKKFKELFSFCNDANLTVYDYNKLEPDIHICE